jgi:hypothetical protein
MGKSCSANWKKNARTLLLRKPKGKRPLARSRPFWVDNIKTNLGEVGLGGTDRIDLAQEGDQRKTFVNAVMNLP